MAYRILLLALLALVLVGCGDPAQDGETIPDVPTSEAVGTQVVVEKQGAELPLGKLLFTHSGNLWMLSGSELRQLTSSGKTVQGAWSPDGERIAYVQREESYSDIYVKLIEANGRGTRVTQSEPPGIEARSLEHTRSVRWALHPTWSPSGRYLAYISQFNPPSCLDGGQCDNAVEYPLSLYITQLSTAEEYFSGPSNQVLVRPDTDLSHPTWSPDGRYIAFAQAERYPAEGLTGMSIALYDVETGELIALPEMPDGSYDPSWSPDGLWLTFARRDGDGTDLWIMAAPGSPQEGSPPKRLTTFGNVRTPVWSPDGQYLAYIQLGASTLALQVSPVLRASGQTPGLDAPVTLINGEPLDVNAGLSWVE